MDFLKTLTFLRGGVHPEDAWKKKTRYHPIERFVPKEVTIPLSQHIGEPARAIVERKTKVVRGDVIAEAGPGGVPVHASVSGTVKRVALAPHPLLTEATAIVIETDFEATPPVWEEAPDWNNFSNEILLESIRAAGIVGLGGAAFPTHRKLKCPPGITIDTLLINGAECEPYLTADHRLILEHPVEILNGAALVAKILGAKKIILGIEDNKIDAAKVLKAALEKHPSTVPVEIRLCKTRYPQGSERQLVEALTGKVVPARKLPMHVGVMVQNVATVLACLDAIAFHKPLIDRVLTVTGSGIQNPKNLSVPIGTLVQDIADYCGGLHYKTVKAIAGGPMMGRALGRLDVPVIKGTSGLIFLREEEVSKEGFGPCISCGRCLEVCPLGLEPNQISIYTEAGRPLETETFGTKDCFECGCCAFVCPAQRPLVQFIQMAKNSFRRVA
ncbi:MAG: electron transport complex subunit RsxC [Deltaproteobacteria bacterium]|nr:electron transport complex subunit RsxC [Deltaproteobacteria bacterium]